MSEARCQRSEDRCQRPEARGQRSDVRGQMSEVRGQRAESIGKMLGCSEGGNGESSRLKAESSKKLGGRMLEDINSECGLRPIGACAYAPVGRWKKD